MAQSHVFPAPVAGWVLTGSPIEPVPQSARVLDNFFCTTTGISARGGAPKYATLGAAAVSMFRYESGGTEKMFATTAADIFDVTSPADPDVAETAAASGMTEGYWSTEQFGTSGGDYLMCVNGADYAQIYDGSSWNPIADEALNTLSYDALTADFAVGETVTGGTSGASAEILGINKTSATAGTLKLGAITAGPFQDNETITSAGGSADADGVNASGSTFAFTGVATTALSAVWGHANRLWFVQEGTTSAWYLPVNSVAGTVVEFPLRSVLRRGGSLLFGTTWSVDAGDGMDDKCVFVSTEGEVAIYAGTDPSSATTWALEGVYDMPRPLGKNAFVRTGGDVLIATETGLTPISAALQSDINAQRGVSDAIAPYWQGQARAIASNRWEIIKLRKRNAMIISQPDSADTDGSALCVNMQTGAWSRFIGWNTLCMTTFNDLGYFGDASGFVYLMDATGSDNGTSYTCKYVGQFEHMGVPGQVKTILQARGLFSAASPVNPKVSVLVDYDETLPTAPSSPANYTADVWDSGLWDTAIWDADASYSTQRFWQSIGATGVMHAPALQLTFGVTPTPLVEFASVDVQYSVGAMVV